MDLIANVILIAVVGGLVIGLVAQTRQLHGLRQQLTDHVRLHEAEVEVGDAGEPESWPAGFAEVGTLLDGVPPVTDGRWRVVVLVETGCSRCDLVAKGLPAVLATVPAGFDVLLATVAGGDRHDPGLEEGMTLAAPESLVTPALLLIDPEGIVQGRGTAYDPSSVAEFIHEAVHHGFGPADTAAGPLHAHHGAAEMGRDTANSGFDAAHQ